MVLNNRGQDCSKANLSRLRIRSAHYERRRWEPQLFEPHWRP